MVLNQFAIWPSLLCIKGAHQKIRRCPISTIRALIISQNDFDQTLPDGLPLQRPQK